MDVVDPAVEEAERNGRGSWRDGRDRIRSRLPPSRPGDLGLRDRRGRRTRPGFALLPPRPCGRRRPRLSGRLHGGARPRAARRTPPTSCASNTSRRCSRPTTTRRRTRSPVPHGAARRVRRRREPGRGDPGRRRVEAARGEVVLLGRRRRPVPRHRSTARGGGRHSRDRVLPRATLRRRVPHSPAQGQARDPRSRHRGDRVRGRSRPSARCAGGRLPHCRRRAQHVPLAQRARLGRAHAPRRDGRVGVRTGARGVRARSSRTTRSSARTWR